MPSTSMRTGSGAGSAAGFASFFSAAAFSSSLSLASGDGRSLRSTTRYTLRVRRLSLVDCANQSSTGPASVEPNRYRYLPLRSNTGSLTSARPSVIGNDFFWSSEYTERVIASGWVLTVYASQRESGDHP